MFQRPQDENRDDVPWFMRYGARALGTVGGGSEYVFLSQTLAYRYRNLLLIALYAEPRKHGIFASSASVSVSNFKLKHNIADS
jgi:hypothetical protein